MIIETQTTEVLKHTVAFTRKVSDGNYGSQEATMYLQFDTPLGTDVADIIQRANERFFAAKAEVLTQLGVKFEMDSSTGELIELEITEAAIMEAFPGTTVVSPPADAPAKVGPAAEGVGDAPPFAADTQDRDEQRLNRTWAKARHATHPQEFWDNRQSKRNPKAPDFKHKNNGIAFWVD